MFFRHGLLRLFLMWSYSLPLVILVILTELFFSSRIFDLRWIKEGSDLHSMFKVFAHHGFAERIMDAFLFAFQLTPQTLFCLIFLTFTEHWAVIFILSTTVRPLSGILVAPQEFVMWSWNCLFPKCLTWRLSILKFICHVLVQSIEYHWVPSAAPAVHVL